MPRPKSRAQARLFFAKAGQGAKWAKRSVAKLGKGSVKRMPGRVKGKK